jgi:ketosteroid isomerase-like protein
MHEPFGTPEAAEDAYYDALEAGDLDALIAIWATNDDIACALPMAPLATGHVEVTTTWQKALAALGPIDLQTRHIRWIHAGDMAIHLVEEIAPAPPGQPAPPGIYATNVYRRFETGWHMVLHQNSPVPPPPGLSAQGAPGEPPRP